MKTSNSLCRPISCLTLVVALASLPEVRAAEPTTLAPATDKTDAKPHGYDLEIVNVQLIRPGHEVDATLPNVVDALRDQYTAANIILAPGLAKLKVGDLKLRAGRLEEQLEAVRVASGDKFEVQGPNGPNPAQLDVLVDPNTGLPLAGTQNLNAGLYVLREAKPTPETRRVVEAFNIGPYLEWSSHQQGTNRPSEDQTLQGVQGMISETLDAFGMESAVNQPAPPAFQYHRGATMLVIIGDTESVEIARKIVNALPGMASVADSSRARYGLESARDPAAADRAAADEAFRKRYGLTRSVRPASQPATAAPEPVPPK
jgi:hypothetical protein